jgi:chromosomal replication initiator protein
MQSEVSPASRIWRVAAERLKNRNKQSYKQWFQPMVPLRLEEETCLVLGVSDPFFAEWITDYYSDFLDSALLDIEGVSYSYSLESGHAAPAEEAAEVKPAVVVPVAAPAAAPAAERESLMTHTFENFVVCEENRYAHMMIKSTVEQPGLYNPLYVFGGSGVGKTHLLQAAHHAATRRSSSFNVRYVSCSDLLDEFYSLLERKRSLSEFRASVRNVDMLLVDDVHLLANKTQMQEEFFKLFNLLYGKQKQIILTSDKQPCEIKGLESRLVTRFESGVTTEIGVPEVEGRFAILRMMRDDTLIKTKLADPILMFLAEQISSSVRRLKGCFMRLASYASMMGGGQLTVEQAEELLSAQLSQESASRSISMEQIQRAVAEQFGLKLNDILSVRRPKNIAEPRLVAMYLCRRLTSNSLPEIGGAFGKTHATILNAVNKVPQLCARDESLRRAVIQLERQLKRG